MTQQIIPHSLSPDQLQRLFQFAYGLSLSKKAAMALMCHAHARLLNTKPNGTLEPEHYMRQVIWHQAQANNRQNEALTPSGPVTVDRLAELWPSINPQARALLLFKAQAQLSDTQLATQLRLSPSQLEAQQAQLIEQLGVPAVDHPPLLEALTQWLASHSLSETELAQFQRSAQPRLRMNKMLWSAVILLVAGLVLLAHTLWQEAERKALLDDLTQALAQDYGQPETGLISGQDLAGLNQALSELPFTLAETITQPDFAQHLSGARYATILGRKSAVLALGDARIYQRPLSKAEADLLMNINVERHPTIRYAQGLEITLWEEHGLLMAQVEKASDSPIRPQAPTLRAPAD